MLSSPTSACGRAQNVVSFSVSITNYFCRSGALDPDGDSQLVGAPRRDS